MFVNQYLVVRELGRGAHGAVKLVYNTDDDAIYAMKVARRGGGRGAEGRFTLGL